MKKKIALFVQPEYGDHPTVSTETLEGTSYIRVSEYVEIEFPMLDVASDQRIQALDKRISELTEDHKQRIAEIEQQKERLLVGAHKE